MLLVLPQVERSLLEMILPKSQLLKYLLNKAFVNFREIPIYIICLEFGWASVSCSKTICYLMWPKHHSPDVKPILLCTQSFVLL